MKSKMTLTAAVILVAAPVLAQQQLPRRIAGYKCMMLTITEQQSMDPTFHVPLRSAPSAMAPEAGWAGSVPIVRNPAVERNGFLQVLKPNGEKAWIAANMVKDYRPAADPTARCAPVVLPNGRVGAGPG